VTPGARLAAEKELIVDNGYKTSLDLIKQAKEGKLELAAGMDLEGSLESSVSGVLSKVRDKCAEICMTELSRHNAPLTMAVCGSKGGTSSLSALLPSLTIAAGSKLNVAQMVACVGQQIISGHRIPDGFPDRSLPHFPKKSKDPPSKGFVSNRYGFSHLSCMWSRTKHFNSFYSGLIATEFIFHAVSGREGLVDTAVKTAETGYMQRRLMKALEDLTARYDLSVRNSVGGMVQFTYGDDALDPAAMESETGPVAFERTWRHAKVITNLLIFL
jgi:DNA-directed RNA polymerase III subunit RPC1